MSQKHAQKTKHVKAVLPSEGIVAAQGEKMDEKKEAIYELIQTTLISPPKTPARIDLDEAGIEELSRSIHDIGLIEPLIVKKTETGFEVVAGHRRLLACRLAHIYFTPCLVVPENERVEDAVKLHENKFRTDLTAIEEAQYFTYLADKKKMGQSAIAEMMNVSESYVSQHLAILSWMPELRDAVAKKLISFTSARELSRVKDLEVLRGYVLHAVHNGVTPAVAMSWVQQWQSYSNYNPDTVPSDVGSGTRGTADVPMFACHFCQQPFPFDETLMVRTCPACLETIEAALKEERRHDG